MGRPEGSSWRCERLKSVKRARENFLLAVGDASQNTGSVIPTRLARVGSIHQSVGIGPATTQIRSHMPLYHDIRRQMVNFGQHKGLVPEQKE